MRIDADRINGARFVIRLNLNGADRLLARLGIGGSV